MSGVAPPPALGPAGPAAGSGPTRFRSNAVSLRRHADGSATKRLTPVESLRHTQIGSSGALGPGGGVASAKVQGAIGRAPATPPEHSSRGRGNTGGSPDTFPPPPP